MNTRTLLPGLFAAACVHGVASADLTGASVEDVSDLVHTPPGLRTYRVFVEFDDPADQLLAISGNQGVAGLSFSTEAPDGLVNDGGPVSGLKLEDFPAFGAAWDSWVTIGGDTFAYEQADYSPGFAGSDGIHNVIKGTEFSHANYGGWFDPNPSTPEDGGSILIAQFTIAEGYAFTLEGTVDYNPGGSPPSQSDWFSVSACTVDIPPCFGGCCIYIGAGNWHCAWTTEGRCDAEGGYFEGVGNDCPGCYDICCDPCPWILPESCPSACPADIDASGAVDFGDMLAVLSAWGPCDACPEDLDESGDVGFADLLLVLGRWGPCLGGACCLPDGSCVQSDVGGDDCVSQGGVYHGDNTVCADVVCTQPGACCFPNGSCVQSDVGGDACANQGGIYQGDDTLCANVGCGACCFPDWTCAIHTEQSCESAGGTFAGEEITCAVVNCAQGACCLSDGSCFVLTPEACDAVGGTYQGGGIPCEMVSCP